MSHEFARWLIILIGWLSMVWPCWALTSDLRSQYRILRRTVNLPVVGLAIYFGVCGFFTFAMMSVP